MKKILKLLLTIPMFLTLVACSNSTNSNDVLDFFNALNNTLNVDSGHFIGTITSNNEIKTAMKFDFEFNQKDKFELAFDLDLEADSNKENQFLSFYIKDRKTYLNSLGTTSQSTADKIGINEDHKLSVSNPFLSYTDDELKSFFTSSKKDENGYTFQIDPRKLELFLDSLATIKIDDAILKAKIEDEYITDLSLKITGVQNIQNQQAIIDIDINITAKDINKLTNINFPKDLEKY